MDRSSSLELALTRPMEGYTPRTDINAAAQTARQDLGATEAEPKAGAPDRFVSAAALRAGLCEWREQLEQVAVQFRVDVDVQLHMLVRFHGLIEKLSRTPEQMSSREVAAAEGCSVRTARRKLAEIRKKGLIYNADKARAGAQRRNSLGATR